jgi:hypothetical protein
MSRAMKEDLFTIKAIQAKGYKMEDLILLSEEELEALPLSQRLIEGVKTVKARGGKTADQIAEDIADLMTQDVTSSVEVDVPQVVETYSTQTPEFIEIQEQIEEEAIVEEIAEDEVEIVRIETAPEDAETVVQVLKSKEYKSFQPYIKLLQNEVPKAILDEVDSTLLTELIEQRIAEVKAEAKKTK